MLPPPARARSNVDLLTGIVSTHAPHTIDSHLMSFEKGSLHRRGVRAPPSPWWWVLILFDSRRVFLFFDFDLVLELPRFPLSHFSNQVQFVSRLHRQLLDLPSRDGLFDLRNRFPAQRHRFPVLVRLRHDRSIRRVVRDELDRVQDLVAQFRVRRDRVVQHGRPTNPVVVFCCSRVIDVGEQNPTKPRLLLLSQRRR